MVSTNEHLSEKERKEIAQKKAAEPMHGRISKPESRAQFLFEAGKLNAGQVNELEGGKFFPETEGDLEDPFAPQDSRNRAPPYDGTIASGGTRMINVTC